MSISLDKILANPKLVDTVSLEWIRQELEKQPYNKYLQGLLEQRSSENMGFSTANTQAILDSIVSDMETFKPGPYYIKDVILGGGTTFTEVKDADLKEKSITAAAIGAGAIITGSIKSGGKEAANIENIQSTEPLSNTKQIEESGLLGFLNRLDGTIPLKKANPSVDPMLKKENYEIENEELLDLTDDLEEVPEQIPTLDKPEDEETEENDGAHPDQLIFTDNIKSKSKKKKVKAQAKNQYRWTSQTPSDYEMSNLDPFTVWINSIDGVEMSSVATKQKKKKKKKKKKQFTESLESKPEIASEQLAELLINQGHYKDAILMYEQLSLKNPEKSSFFAAKIETIKDKI